MVGMARLELATPRSQSECATNCATPRLRLDYNIKEFADSQVVIVKFFGVNDGDRTRDNRNHNPMLYQLSYIHHAISNYTVVI